MAVPVFRLPRADHALELTPRSKPGWSARRSGTTRQSDLWACLAQIYVDEYAFGFQDRRDISRSGPGCGPSRESSWIGRTSSRSSRWRRRTSSARTSRRLVRRPSARWPSIRSTPTRSGFWGCRSCTRASSSEVPRSCSRAMELNANHAGWMHFAPLWDHFHKGEYEQALECANRVDVPGLFWPYLVMASACGHLGRRAEAAAAVRDLLGAGSRSLRRTRARTSGPGTSPAASWIPSSKGCAKPGSRFPRTRSSDSPRRKGAVRAKAKGQTAPGAAPAKSIAVLPFVNMSADKNDEYLSDGMTEELINSLAKVPGLRVPGRTSCFAFKGKTEADIFRKVGDQLHVDTVLEGSVRKAGEKLRVTAQLINVS